MEENDLTLTRRVDGRGNSASASGKSSKSVIVIDISSSSSSSKEDSDTDSTDEELASARRKTVKSIIVSDESSSPSSSSESDSDEDSTYEDDDASSVVDDDSGDNQDGRDRPAVLKTKEKKGTVARDEKAATREEMLVKRTDEPVMLFSNRLNEGCLFACELCDREFLYDIHANHLGSNHSFSVAKYTEMFGPITMSKVGTFFCTFFFLGGGYRSPQHTQNPGKGMGVAQSFVLLLRIRIQPFSQCGSGSTSLNKCVL